MAWRLKSLGWASELHVANRYAEILDRGEYLRVRTAEHLGYLWGNCLVFRRPPRLGDYARWREIYEREFNEPRPYRYVTIGWESDPRQSAETCEFLEKDFSFDEGAVLTAKVLRKSGTHRTDLIVAPALTEADWTVALDAHLGHLCANDVQREFGRWRFDHFRRLQREGLGHWFLARLPDGTPVGHLGIFVVDGLARFQQVLTYEGHRRSSVARSMVFEAAEWIRQRFAVKDFVILSDLEGGGRPSYEAVGFALTERQESLRWFGGKS